MMLTWWILLLAAALGCLVSALHYALRDISLVKLEQLVEARGGARQIEAILSDVDGHVLATGALRVVCNVAITVCLLMLFSVFGAAPAGSAAAGGSGVTLDLPRLAGAVVMSSAVLYILGLVVPMSIAEHAGERVIKACAALLRVVYLLAWPVRALTVFDMAIKRLAGVGHVSEGEQIEDEILSAATEGEREGQLGETQREMIEAVVDFKARTVKEVMTPRTEIEGFELTDDLGFIRRFVESCGHSRIPVYVGDLDHIVGVLYVKDLLKFLGTDTSGLKLRPLLRRPVWVPETKPLTELLYELRARKVHMAIVLDEYGGTTGLVTFEDILEEIVGEIQDEYEPREEAIPEITVNERERWAEIEARAYLKDANSALADIGLELPEGPDYDTVGGYVLSALGHIPVPGETIGHDSFVLTVLQAEPTRVTRVRVAARESRPDEEPQEQHEPASRVDEDEQAVVGGAVRRLA